MSYQNAIAICFLQWSAIKINFSTIIIIRGMLELQMQNPCASKDALVRLSAHQPKGLPNHHHDTDDYDNPGHHHNTDDDDDPGYHHDTFIAAN